MTCTLYNTGEMAGTGILMWLSETIFRSTNIKIIFLFHIRQPKIFNTTWACTETIDLIYLERNIHLVTLGCPRPFNI
jgi:hypothetical protein